MALHGTAPRTVLGEDWWKKEREKVKRDSRGYCAACGEHFTNAVLGKVLDAHECYDIDYMEGTMTYVQTVALCKACHLYVHKGFMRSQVAAKKMAQELMDAVVERGDMLLREAGLTLLRPSFKNSAAWEDWRLVVHGKKYRGRFPTEDDYGYGTSSEMES